MNVAKLTSLLFALVLLPPAWTHTSRPALIIDAPSAAAPQDEIEEDEYVVLSAVINGREREGDSSRALVIGEETSPWEGFGGEGPERFYGELKKSSKELKAETVDDFRARNKEPHRLTRRFDIRRPYVITGAGEIKGYFKKGGGYWKKFYEKYPNSDGFQTFSRVGFNAEKTQALVYVEHSCGGLCGGGGYLLLAKRDGAWVVASSVGPTWVS